MLRILGLIFALFLGASPALAWRVAETPHFRIYSEGSVQRLQSDAAALEDYHRLLELLTGKKFSADAPPLDIYMIDGRKEMQIFVPNVSDSIAGMYMATPGGILALSEEGSVNPAAWNSGRQTLLHEYAHHFMMQTGGTAPAWYVEGFAEYLMTATFKPDKVEFGLGNPGRFYVLTSMPWIDLEKLLGSEGRKTPDQFYAQSWLLTHYMFRNPEMAPKLKEYLRRVSSGEESVSAFKAAVSEDLPAFQRELRRYMRSSSMTYSRLKREPPGKEEIRINYLPSSAEKILLPLASMQLPQKKETDERNLKRIRDAAARNPGDPYAEKALAIAEAIGGDGKLAAAKLDTLLAQLPNDVDLLRWRASLYLDNDKLADEDRLKARRLLVRAFKQVPNDWQVLLAYVDSFDSGEKLPPNVLDVLLKATMLAPQVSELGVRAGFELARAGNYSLAYEILAPAVLNPHGKQESSIEKLLQALKTGEKGQVDAAFEAFEKKGVEVPDLPTIPEPGPAAHQ
ncbi:hypothetical protein [Sandaracinobacteroides hominis]|uniref:hypothetical protein n=1 Tax=Sandaracinobacteroides hominis TaxID=2780086 RepID=UPI0018F331DA|nr:hypothetical protein [Sandaracinobacteroides hominis]